MAEAAPLAEGREALLIAAERLFAEKGLHGISLRQIVEASGQKNASAIQYHFGARERLVEAVFAYRMSAINPRRQARLDAAAAAGRLDDLRTLVSIWAWPLAEELAPRPGGNHYLQFLAHALRERALGLDLWRTELLTAWADTSRHISRVLAYLPPAIVRARLLVASAQCVNALAAFEAEGLGGGTGFTLDIENLIDMLTGALAAPVAPAALAAARG